MSSTPPHRGRRPRIPGWLVALLALAALPALTGCTTASYLVQAGFGQLDLLEARRDIDEVVHDRRTTPRLRALLGRVEEIKRFGETQGLTPTSNYTTYADLDRPVAVWVVTAAEPLRFRNRTWSFPIVGSVPYLGFFDRDDARGLARDLRAAGWDVDLRGASAYSTLGWFADPVLSTMIGGGDEALGELADVVLHESFHATHYVKGQSLFDESAADFVGDHLAEAYLDQATGPESPEKKAFIAAQDEHEARGRKMRAAYVKLEALYARAIPRADKLAEKARILAELGRDTHARRPITNATLGQFDTYDAGRAELAALLAACGGSFPRFVGALRGVGPASFREPQQRDLGAVLAPLTRAACPQAKSLSR
jgi:predicted aminopeptidase